MRLQDGNGLDVIEAIRERRDDTRIIVLTGYGNIATAVTAVKLGAIDYLAKPADADEVYAALTRKPGERAEVPENPMSADRVRWEHIQRVYEMCERNVSETARRLNMHRRTLQRILAKRAPLTLIFATRPASGRPEFSEQKAVGRRPGKAQQHRLARCGGKAVLRGLAQQMRGPAIGDDQPAVLRKKLGRDAAMRGEEQPVAVLR
jgi:CheY-like chemotaxis protein